MTTDEIFAAAAERAIRVWAAENEEGARYDAVWDVADELARAAVDAVAPLLIAQGRREAAEAIRAADYWLEQAARYAEGDTP